MVDKILGLIAPHYCFSCEVIGAVLCESCKNNIISDGEVTCLGCGRVAGSRGVCSQCRPGYTRAWAVGLYHSSLGDMIRSMKANGTRETTDCMADLLFQRLPTLPATVRIVPLPTIAAHRRTRGFDHTLMMAKALGRRTGRVVDCCIERRQNTSQRGKGRAERLRQAQRAFMIKKPIDPDAIYLLIDDVVTTGASMSAAAQCLRQAGATTVWAAAIAHESLDDTARI